MDDMPVNTDAQVRPAAARPPLLGRRLLSRYEASALSACSLKTIVRCIRSPRAGGLGGRAVGAPPWSLFRGRLGGCSGTPHARLLGERVASTRGISSLAQSHGAQRISAAACSVSPVSGKAERRFGLGHTETAFSSRLVLSEVVCATQSLLKRQRAIIRRMSLTCRGALPRAQRSSKSNLKFAKPSFSISMVCAKTVWLCPRAQVKLSMLKWPYNWSLNADTQHQEAASRRMLRVGQLRR